MAKFNRQKSRKSNINHIIYGLHSVKAALLNKKREHLELIVNENQRNFAKKYDQKIKKIRILDNKDFKQKYGNDQTTQGIVLHTKEFTKPSLNEFLENEDVNSKSVIVVLDQITDPQNIGSIMRSCAMFDCKGIIVAKDNSPEWLSWQHAVRNIIDKEGSFDHFLSLPSTAPLRIKNDVQCCMRALGPNIDLVVTITKANKNPWFNIVKLDESSNIVPVLKTPGISRRQDAPDCFDLTPVAYVTRPEFILENSSMWDGNVRGIEIPNERSIDIDTPMDFLIAKLLLESKDNNI